MGYTNIYERRATVAMRLLPYVAPATMFVLKGGTAINMFIRNMERLSVDIDLSLLSRVGWPQAYEDIQGGLMQIAKHIKDNVKGVKVDFVPMRKKEWITQLNVTADGVTIKIEAAQGMPGCVHAPTLLGTQPKVSERFGYTEMQTASFEDVYAEKIVAALSRSTGRDLFDMMKLFENEGVSDSVKSTFIVHLLADKKLVPQVITPKTDDITATFHKKFKGMTDYDVDIKDIERARDRTHTEMVVNMAEAHKQTILDYYSLKPDWSKIGLPQAAEMPAIQRRLDYLKTLTPEDRAAHIKEIKAVLYPSGPNKSMDTEKGTGPNIGAKPKRIPSKDKSNGWEM